MHRQEPTGKRRVLHRFIMNSLQDYLNDHLAGAAGALRVTTLLRRADPSNADFYSHVEERISSNRDVLLRVMKAAGCERSELREFIGKVTAFAGQLRLRISGLGRAGLGRLEALELLVLGIEGQCALWTFLGEAAREEPRWTGFDFGEMEASARRLQKEVAARHDRAFLEVFRRSRSETMIPQR